MRIKDKIIEVQDLIRENPSMDLEDIAVLAGVDVDFVQDVVEVYSGV